MVLKETMDELLDALLKQLNVTPHEFRVTNQNLYERLSGGGDFTMIFGEAYMNNEWASNDLAAFFRKIMTFENYGEMLLPLWKESPLQSSKLIWGSIVHDLKTQWTDHFQNNQSVDMAKRVGEQHYDIPDILYEHMLDPHRQYTCGYWCDGVANLSEAQEAKLKLLIDKLKIPENQTMTILDIGCGWGGLTKAISERYPLCRVEGISISQEQIKYANDTHASAQLKYYYCDYRDLPRMKVKYDRIISVGMFEHVGAKNYDVFFDTCRQILTDDGIFVLHTVTHSVQLKYLTGQDKFIVNEFLDKYVFPGAYVPTVEQIMTSVQSKDMMYHHIQNLSISYAKTLGAWNANFQKHWLKIQASDPAFFTISFKRMWEFYLLGCMVSFEKKHLQLSQFVFTKNSFGQMYVF